MLIFLFRLLVIWLVTLFVVEGLDMGVLSLLFFFYFSEEVSSKGISELISKKLIFPMVGPWGI